MAATIIAGLIAAGAGIYAGEEQNKATLAAQKEARGLAVQQRQDVLAQNRAQRMIQQQQFGTQTALTREQIGLTERLQSAQLGQQKARDMAARQQERYDRAISIISNNASLKNRMRQLFGGA